MRSRRLPMMKKKDKARLLLQLGFVLPRVVEVVVLGRHGVIVVVDHVIREGAADRFLADGLDVRQGRADARALRREGRSGGTMRVSRAERPGRVDSGRTCRSSSFSRRASAVAWSGATNAPPRPRGRTAGHVSGNTTGASGNMVARGRVLGVGETAQTQAHFRKSRQKVNRALAAKGGFVFITSTRASPRWRTSRCAMRARSTGKAATLSRDPRSTRTRRSTTRGTTPSGTSKAE